MAGSIAIAVANRGGSVAWVAPTYKNSRPLWRFVESICAGTGVALHRADKVAAFPSGGWLGIFSGDSPDSIRGEAFDLVILDEAARIVETVWADAIQPTLADRSGRAILISTPAGRNWFYRLYLAGQRPNDDVISYHAPTSANPDPRIRAAYEAARRLVGPRTFAQEWDARFVEDGALFPNIDACITAQPQARALPDHAYVIGVDWAREAGGDYTVMLAYDATTQSVARIERLSGAPYDVQRARLISIWQDFNQCPVIAEANSMGGPQIEALQLAGVNVIPFMTTIASKHEIISALELALAERRVALVNDIALTTELRLYERIERGGIPRYGAPPGEHDDCVMALALAHYGAQQAATPAAEVVL